LDTLYIRKDRGTLSPRVIKLAEYELWEIEKKKRKNENFDLLIEKRLKKLILA